MNIRVFDSKLFEPAVIFMSEAAEIALLALNHEMDYYVDFTLRHTIRRLEPVWKEAVGSGKEFAAGNAKAIEYIIDRVATPDLINMTRSEPVYKAILNRPGIVHQYGHEALMGIAKINQTDMVAELVNTVRNLDASTSETAEQVLTEYVHMFRMTDPAMLKMKRADIAQLHRAGKRAVTRRLATAA